MPACCHNCSAVCCNTTNFLPVLPQLLGGVLQHRQKIGGPDCRRVVGEFVLLRQVKTCGAQAVHEFAQSLAGMVMALQSAHHTFELRNSQCWLRKAEQAMRAGRLPALPLQRCKQRAAVRATAVTSQTGLHTCVLCQRLRTWCNLRIGHGQQPQVCIAHVCQFTHGCALADEGYRSLCRGARSGEDLTDGVSLLRQQSSQGLTQSTRSDQVDAHSNPAQSTQHGTSPEQPQ